MKILRLLTLICALACMSLTNAQVTTEPAQLSVDATGIKIFFHADEGNKGLAGSPASTKIYAHTGVITSTSRDDSDWQYAPSWNENNPKYEMEYVSPNLWSLYIGSINEFYGITNSNVVVKKLAFVFRNSDGSKTGKAAGDKDIFVEVLNDSFEMSMTTDIPSSIITPENPIVNFTVTTTKPAEISLTCKGEVFASVKDATELTSSYSFPEPGNYIVTAAAEREGETKRFSKSITYITPSEMKEYPGGVPQMGPRRNDDGTVTFCLCAPMKQSVMLLGSWNDFSVAENDLMYRQDYEGNSYFWKNVDGLDSTTPYLYYFIVDTQTRVGDPYARLVLDEQNDNYITDVVYPDMPKYPHDKVSGVALSVFQENINDYDWQVTDFKTPAKDDLIIYELLLRDFTGTDGKALGNGTVRGAMEKIPYLKDLGINAVELLPINEFNGNNSWGYNPNFYFAPDKAYGTPDDYKEFIDKCHAEGIAVILDMVFNQTDWQHPWYRLYPVGSNPFYNASAPHAYSVLNDWNQGNPLVRQQWKDVVRYWIEEYNVDGYRFDLVKGLGDNDSYANNGDAATNAYNASRVANMREIQEAMLEVKPDAIFINENLAQAKEENEMAAFGQLNWANINNEGCQYAMGYSTGSGLARMYAPDDSRTWGSTVSYLESHDEQRLAYKQLQWGQPEVKNDKQVAMNRLASCAAQMILSPGSHMIWQFSEMGNSQNTKNNDGGNNVDPKIVSWYLLQETPNFQLQENYRQLIHIRRNNPEMFSEEATFTSRLTAAAWGNGRWMISRLGDREIVTVLNPNSESDKTITVPVEFLSKKDSDYQILSASYGTKYSFSAEKGEVTVEPNGYVVIGSNGLTKVSPVVGEDERELNLMILPGVILIPGNQEIVEVYSVDGALRYRDAGERIEVSPGIYVVRAGERVGKVIVK